MSTLGKSQGSSSPSSSSSLLDPNETFATLSTSLGLDIRLRKALARLGYVRPTLVQSKSLPLAITSGRDLLVRARTGSGKTLAYCLPVLHKILLRKSKEGQEEEDAGDGEGRQQQQQLQEQNVRAVILVPTRELCQQVHRTLMDLTYYCDEVISVTVLLGGANKKRTKKGGGASSNNVAAQEAMLRDKPDILVSTPAGLLTHTRSGALDLRNSVESLVVDEADLVLSFGYANDVNEITKSLPKICQGFLMSATLSPEVDSLKKVVLHSPAILKLEEEEERNFGKKVGQLTQFYLRLPKRDKNLVLYVFLKLGLLKGKGLFFVNTTDNGYRLKLFLEQFHIRSAVLNAELPLRSRLNIIDQFNVGNFDYLIATDESANVGTGKKSKEESDEEEEVEEDGDDTSDRKKQSKKAKGRSKRQRSRKKDGEYGVSRGLDFRNVSFVVNVDFPVTAESYTHRVGRTARGGAKGVALSLVEADSREQNETLELVQESQPKLPLALGSAATAGGDELHAADGATDESQATAETIQYQSQPSPLDFDLSEIEGFRYRVEDVSRAVTHVAVRETRAAELRAEMLNSERLQQTFFGDNKSDLHLLRHDRVATHVSKVQDHLKHVPKYLLPRGMQVAEARKRKKRRLRKNRGCRSMNNDPLRSYEGDNVNLDGVADGDEDPSKTREAKDYEEFFEEEGEGGDEKRQKSDQYGEDDDSMDDTNGFGKGTAGRNAWKERHKKGKFSRKYRNKNQVEGGRGIW